jgi:hypothetical protein
MYLNSDVAFARAQREYENRMPPEPDFDCECESDHNDCDDCDCVGHIESCPSCDTAHGCRCDDMYEDWKDRQMERDWDDDY